MFESLDDLRSLMRVSDTEFARMLTTVLEKEPALSGCKGHECEPIALRGVPTEVPGSNHRKGE